MNEAHWHLMLNHLPIEGMIAGAAVLAAGYIFGNNTTIKRTGVGIIFISSLLAIPAYLSGEGAEEIAERLPGVTEQLIEHHEELAKTFLIFSLILGFISLLSILADWKKHKYASYLYMVVLVLTIGASVLSRRVATSGGEIRHTEIREGAAQNNTTAGETEEGDDD